MLQEAARSVDLLRSIGETPPLDEAIAILSGARTNNALVPTGREVWEHAMTGDGVLPHERRRADGAPEFPEATSLSPLLLRLVDEAIAGSDEAATQAVELIDVAARSGTLLPLEAAQERMWARRGDGWPARLAGLAAMLGFAPASS